MQKFQRRKSIVSIPHNMIIYCAAAEKNSFRYNGPDYMVQMMVLFISKVLNSLSIQHMSLITGQRYKDV